MIFELAERYRKLYSGVVYDALYYDVKYRKRFVVNRGIGMLSGQGPLAGPAFTCWGTRPTTFKQTGEEVEDLDAARMEIFEALCPDEVVVIDTDRDTTVAHFGDITASLMIAAGVSGVILDGYTRDLAAIRRQQFPLFARGAQPQDAYGKWGLQHCSHPIQLETTGGNRIRITHGDWIFADADGVLVIPESLAEEVCEKAEARAKHETEIRDAINNGFGPTEVYRSHGRW